jgi:hypothetical protein
MTYTQTSLATLRSKTGSLLQKLSSEFGLVKTELDALAAAVDTITRSATIVVAASDSSEKSKAQADYVCDGTNDEVEIQAAITALPVVGGKVYLCEGNYLKGAAAGITVPSNVELELNNAAIIKLADGINADACIFTNADQTGGNSNIIISGGTLEGNEENQTAGSMYGINFVKVTNSKIDCWIKGFRSYDAKLNDCSGTILENRWFGTKWNKSELLYDNYYTITGNNSLTINLTTPIDLRNRKLTFLTTNYYTNVFLTPFGGTEFAFANITGSGYPIVTRTAVGNLYKMECAPNIVSENYAHAAELKNISQIRIAYWTDTSYIVGEVRSEPLPDRPLISISFDDGGEEFHDIFAPVLESYGYRGNISYQSTYGDNIEKIKTLYNSYGWDVISHTYTHADLTTITDTEALQEYVWSRRYLEANGMARAAHIIAAPMHKINNAKYRLALQVYGDVRGLSRYNQGANLQTPWIQNYVTTPAESIFRARRTHSWEHMVFHRTNLEADIIAFCELIKAESIDVVTFSEIYGRYQFTNWEQSKSIKNTGTATITAGATTVDVTHGLAAAPTRVLLSPTTATGGKDFYVSAKGATTFTITIDSAHSADISFDWSAVI